MDLKDKYRISVTVITYNQEKLIGRALDSILQQREWGLKEIIVSDDCSVDGNWNVILDYAKKYPGIVKPFRNVKNLGIHENIEYALSKVTETDIVFKCAGDDEFCNGLFREAVLLIERESIDVKKDLFCLYFDWKEVSTDGNERIFSNSLIGKGYNPLSLKIRGLIFNRSVGFSPKVMKKFTPVPKNLGISVAEGAFDIQLQLFAEKNYYHPFIGSVYYRGIGISTTMNNEQERQNYIRSLKQDLEIPTLTQSDKHFLRYQIFRTVYSLSPSIKSLLATWVFYFKSFESKYGFKLSFVVKDFAKMIIKRK